MSGTAAQSGGKQDRTKTSIVREILAQQHRPPANANRLMVRLTSAGVEREEAVAITRLAMMTGAVSAELQESYADTIVTLTGGGEEPGLSREDCIRFAEPSETAMGRINRTTGRAPHEKVGLRTDCAWRWVSAALEDEWAGVVRQMAAALDGCAVEPLEDDWREDRITELASEWEALETFCRLSAFTQRLITDAMTTPTRAESDWWAEQADQTDEELDELAREDVAIRPRTPYESLKVMCAVQILDAWTTCQDADSEADATAALRRMKFWREVSNNAPGGPLWNR